METIMTDEERDAMEAEIWRCEQREIEDEVRDRRRRFEEAAKVQHIGNMARRIKER